MKTIQEQIDDLQNTREVKIASMQAITEKCAAEGVTKDAEQREQFDTLSAEVDTIDAELKDLRRMAELQAKAAKAVDAGNTTKAAESRDHSAAIIKRREETAPGILFARHAMCVFAAKGNLRDAAAIAHQQYGEDSPVAKSLGWANGRSMETVLKATVAAGTTSDSTWAKPLVEYVNYAGDFVEYLRPRTLVGQFGTGNIPALRRIPFNVHIKGQTAGGTGYWVGEGAPKPVTKFGFNDTYHGWYKVAAIAVLTDELIRFSDPSAETYVRDSLADVLIERIDTDFIDPTFAGSSNVSPASIAYGATTVHSTGNDGDAIRKDINAAFAAADAANHDFDTPVLIMRSSAARAVAAMQNALGQPEFPNLTPRGGTLAGIPVLVSSYVPAGDSTGGYVVLVNASDIYLSDDGQATVDFSRDASLQMLDNPTNHSGTGTATSLVSMFQTDSTALRAHRFINYSKRRSTAVAVIDQVNWGA